MKEIEYFITEPPRQVAIFLIISFILIFIIFLIGKLMAKFEPSLEAKSIVRQIINGPKWHLITGYIFVTIGIFTVFLGGDQIPLWRKLLGVLISEFGFAFFIAYVLHITVEFHTSMERDKEISQGILSHIYGSSLDNRVFNEIESNIFKCKFYRRSLSLEYEFIAKNEDKVFIKYTAGYFIENVDCTDNDYEIRTSVEKPTNFSNSGSIWPYEIGLYRIKVDGVFLSKSDIAKARDVTQNSENFIQSSYPLRLKAGEKKLVQCVLFFEKCSRDAELFRCLWPTSDLTLKIRWDPSFNLVVKADPVHCSSKFDDGIVCDDGTLEATLMRPFLPDNGVYFWWGPKDLHMADKSGGIIKDIALKRDDG